MIIHSLVLALDGRACRKSLGTGIEPDDVIEQYGADATRYGLLKMSSTQDVRFSPGFIEEGRKLANKLWNVARLILANAEGVTPDARPKAFEEQWMIARLDEAHAEVTDSIESFEFARLAGSLYRTTFDDFCDWYAEATAAAVRLGPDGARDGPRAARAAAARPTSIR